jgi:hypothetical protein
MGRVAQGRRRAAPYSSPAPPAVPASAPPTGAISPRTRRTAPTTRRIAVVAGGTASPLRPLGSVPPSASGIVDEPVCVAPPSPDLGEAPSPAELASSMPREPASVCCDGSSSSPQAPVKNSVLAAAVNNVPKLHLQPQKLAHLATVGEPSAFRRYVALDRGLVRTFFMHLLLDKSPIPRSSPWCCF